MIDSLVVGGDSLIGRALLQRLRTEGLAVLGTSRRTGTAAGDLMHLDLANRPITPLAAKTVFMCAGITDLKRCESDPVGTRRVNVEATMALLEAAHAAGSRVVYLSSHAVFDGSRPMLTVDAPTSAVIEYGRQKAEVEQKVLALGPRACVVRMTKVISSRVVLISKWLAALQRGEDICPFEDLVMSPISLRFLVSVLADHAGQGIVHVSSQTQLNYAEFAANLVCVMGFPPDLVHPVKAREAGIELLYQPKFTTLGMEDTERRYGVGPQSLESVMADLVLECSVDCGT